MKRRYRWFQQWVEEGGISASPCPQMPPFPLLGSETHLGLRNPIECDSDVNLLEY